MTFCSIFVSLIIYIFCPSQSEKISCLFISDVAISVAIRVIDFLKNEQP